MKYKIYKGFIIQKLDNSTVIFDGEQSVLYTLNEVASFIFHKIKSGAEKEKIITLITRTYSVSKEKAEKDFDELITDLKKKKIVYSS